MKNIVPVGTWVRRLKKQNWMAGHITGHLTHPDTAPVRYLIQWQASQPSSEHGRDEFHVIKDQQAARERWLENRA